MGRSACVVAAVVVCSGPAQAQAPKPEEIVTSYKLDETLGIHVPAEMRDWYPDGSGEIRGVATYARFRRFQVRTDQDVARPTR